MARATAATAVVEVAWAVGVVSVAEAMSVVGFVWGVEAVSVAEMV